jgi:hypothetical protein
VIEAPKENLSKPPGPDGFTGKFHLTVKEE